MKGAAIFVRRLRALLTNARRHWRSIPRATRIFVRVSFLSAGVLAGLGIYLDVERAWEHHPFLVNLVSGVTAFATAAPIALLIFGSASGAITERLAFERAMT